MYHARVAADLLDYGIYVLIMGSTRRRDYGMYVATCHQTPRLGKTKLETAQEISQWP